MDFELNVVLHEPEIPQNTGNIGRLCLATKTKLHLIEPLGFELTDHHLKRAGLDYWEYLDVRRYKNFEEFIGSIPKDAPMCFLTKKAGRTIHEHSFESGSYLVFGKETAGLPDYIINTYAADSLRIPMFDARVRSLNLANSVGIVVYEAVRQLQRL